MFTNKFNEMRKEVKKAFYLELWYKEIVQEVYGKDYIEKKEKEFIKKYNL